MLLVLYVVFSHLMKIQVEHYQLFLLLGIILWNFLDRGTSMGIFGIVGKPALVQKVYFPRDVLIISACTTALMMTALEFIVFVAFMAVLGWRDGGGPLLPLIFASSSSLSTASPSPSRPERYFRTSSSSGG